MSADQAGAGPAGRARSRRHIRRRWVPPGREVALLIALALAVRVLAWLLRPAVLNDTADLFEAAERVRADGWVALLHVRHHPLPVLLLSWIPESADAETWASLGAIVAGSLAVGPLHVIARVTGGRHAATLACLVYAVLPKLVSVASVPLAEPVFLPLFAAAFSAILVAPAGRTPLRRMLRPTLAGALAGLAYLARPEGIVAGAAVVVAALWRGRRGERLRAAGFAALAFAAIAGPYIAQLSAVQGHLALSTKKDLFELAGVAGAPLDDGVGGTSGIRGLVDSLWGVLGLVLVPVVIGALARVRWQHVRARSARAVLLGTAVILCAAIVRLKAGWGYAGGRHAVGIAVVLLPFAGEGMITVVGFLSRAVRRRRAALGLALLLLTPLAVTAILRPDGESGLRERVLGERIAAIEDARGGAHDVHIGIFHEPLVAYYADRELRRLHEDRGEAAAGLRVRRAHAVRLWRQYKTLLNRSADLPGLRKELAQTLRRREVGWIVLRFWRAPRDRPDLRGPGEDLASALLEDGTVVPPAVGSEDLAALEVTK